jgi:hypothetical protein
MCSTQVGTSADVVAAFDALDAAVATLRALNWDSLETPALLRAVEKLETSQRRQIALSHDVVGRIARRDGAEIGGPVHKVIADVLRVSYSEARRRIRDAEQLSPRVSISGQEMAPDLPATADAWQAGILDDQHLR